MRSSCTASAVPTAEEQACLAREVGSWKEAYLERVWQQPSRVFRGRGLVRCIGNFQPFPLDVVASVQIVGRDRDEIAANVESLTSLSEAGLYRDYIHASWTGSFIAGLAAYTSLYGVKPTGIDPLDYNLFDASSSGLVLSQNGATVLSQIVWDAYTKSA